MPVPKGQITTTETWTKPAPVEEVLEEAIKEADAEEATEEFVLEESDE